MKCYWNTENLQLNWILVRGFRSNKDFVLVTKKYMIFVILGDMKPYLRVTYISYIRTVTKLLDGFIDRF